jgi:hypothetical protein
MDAMINIENYGTVNTVSQHPQTSKAYHAFRRSVLGSAVTSQKEEVIKERGLFNRGYETVPGGVTS